MTPLRSLVLTCTALTAVLAGTSGAQADDRNRGGWSDPHYPAYNYNQSYHNDHDRDWDDHRGYDDRYDHRSDYRYNYWNVSLSPWEREEATRRLYDAYNDKCGTRAGRSYYNCRSPQAYQIGRRLPSNIVFWNVPGNVSARLPRPQHGTQYIWVDRDILLISYGDRTVLDRVISLW